MASRKVTISLETTDLDWLRQRAKRLNEGNLSAAFVDGLHELRRQEALEDFLRLSKASVLTAADVAEVLAEVRGVELAKPRRKGGRSRRAA